MNVSLIIMDINGLKDEFDAKSKNPSSFNLIEFVDKCSKIIPAINLETEFTDEELDKLIDALKVFKNLLLNIVDLRDYNAIYESINELENKKESSSVKQLGLNKQEAA